jgi:dTMP kinase
MSRRRGISIALLGPDGSGKSTLAGTLKEMAPRRVEVMKLQLSRSRPLGSQAVRWLIGTTRVVGVALRARLALARGRLVVWDRHPLEDAVTSAEGRRVLGPGRSWLARLFPAPHLIVVLDAHPEQLLARRTKEDPAQLARLRSIYLALAAEHHVRAVVVDATRPAGEVHAIVRDAVQQLAQDGHD